MEKEIVDHCACGCKRPIYAYDVAYKYDDFRFKCPDCVAKYVGAVTEKAMPYKVTP